MAASGAFSEYSSADRLEAASLPPTGSARNPLVALTRGLTCVLPQRGTGAGGASGAAPPAAASQQPQRLTLPDGHLNVGTHLPLLAGRYKYLSTLGEGVSSRVILAEDSLAPTPGRLVAIKIMRRQHAAAGQREARALRYLHGSAPGGAAPGVFRLLDSFSLGAHYCLVTERLFPWLLDWIADSSALPAAEALAQLRKIAHQLLVAVAFLHNCGIVNGDIKPDNLLLQHPPGSSSVGVRLVDFGACFSLTETDTQAVGCEVQTLPWRAPEAALGLPYGAAIDCWGCGVVLAEMALRRMLLPCATPRDLLHQMASLLGPLPEGLVDASPLGQQLDLFALCRPAAGGSGRAAAAAAAGRALPPELAQRAAAAAAAASASRQQAPPPPRAATSPLYAELAAVDPQLADLVLGLLAFEPGQRLTAHQALLHPFFDPICPLRAVFPQLGAPCRVQQAALLSESAAAAAAAGPTGRGAVAAGGPTSVAAARIAAGAAGPSRWHPEAPPRLAVAPQPPAAAPRQTAGSPGSAAAARATAAGAPAGMLAGAKPGASPLARGRAGMPSPEAVSAAAAAEAAAALDAALASAAVAALHGSARRQQQGARALPAATAAAEATRQQTKQQQQQQRQQQRQQTVHQPAAAGPTKPAAGAAVAERRDGSSRQRQRKAAAADAAAAARRAEEQAEDGARAFDLLLEAAAVEDGIDDWAAGPAGPAGRTAGQGKQKQPPASAKKPRKQPAGAAAAAAAAADGLPAAAAKPQPAKRQRPKQPKQQPEEQAQLGQPKPKPQQQRPKQPRQEQPQVARPQSAAASSAKPLDGVGGGAAAGGGAAVPGAAGSKAGSSKKPRPQAAPPAKRPPEGQQAAQEAAQQQPAAAGKPRKQPAAAATPAAQQPGGGAQPAAAPKRKRQTSAGASGDAEPLQAAAAEAPASPHAAVAPTAAEPTIPATAKRQRRERPPDAKPWWCV